MQFVLRLGIIGGMLAGMLPMAIAQTGSEYQDEIGYTELVDRLGLNTPDGTGVEVAMIEAPANPPTSTLYLPSTSFFTGSLVDATGISAGVSSHASSTARNFFGTANGIATGVPTIYGYEALNYMEDGFLKGDASGQADPNGPGTVFGGDTAFGRIQNHSWVGAPAASNSIDILQRFDYMIDVADVVDGSGTPLQNGVVAVVGAGNGLGAMPHVMGNSYNAIVVGVSDPTGTSSNSGSTLEVLGRSKPDISAPAHWQPFVSSKLTSRATARVSGAATLLMQTAIDNADTPAQRPETIKALLLTGATKDELPSWSHTDTQPLDLQHGAGELNIDNSHRILTDGHQEASSSVRVKPSGWDLDSISGGDSAVYYFEVPPGLDNDGLSATLTWHRRVDLIESVGLIPAVLIPSLADLDLRLFDVGSGATLTTELERSISTIDNVEHIFLDSLAPGGYALEVSAKITGDLSPNDTWQYALAWDTNTLIPGDANRDGVVDIGDFTVWGTFFGVTDPTFQQGDFNGDNLVDLGDYTLWGDAFGDTIATHYVLPPLPGPGPLPAPEPSALLLSLWAALLAGLSRGVWRRRLRRV